MEELNTKNYELELKLKEKANLIEIFKAESDSYSVKLNQLEEELNKKFESESEFSGILGGYLKPFLKVSLTRTCNLDILFIS